MDCNVVMTCDLVTNVSVNTPFIINKQSYRLMFFLTPREIRHQVRQPEVRCDVQKGLSLRVIF
jgi:hypothetical protein